MPLKNRSETVAWDSRKKSRYRKSSFFLFALRAEAVPTLCLRPQVTLTFPWCPHTVLRHRPPSFPHLSRASPCSRVPRSTCEHGGIPRYTCARFLVPRSNHSCLTTSISHLLVSPPSNTHPAVHHSHSTPLSPCPRPCNNGREQPNSRSRFALFYRGGSKPSPRLPTSEMSVARVRKPPLTTPIPL